MARVHQGELRQIHSAAHQHQDCRPEGNSSYRTANGDLRSPLQCARCEDRFLSGIGLGLHTPLPGQLCAPYANVDAAGRDGATQLARIRGDPNGNGGLEDEFGSREGSHLSQISSSI